MKRCFCLFLTTTTAILHAGCGTPVTSWRGRPPTPKSMEATPLIDRAVLFGNPDRASPEISPDGTRLAFLAEVHGVMNVWVGPLSDPSEAKPVTNDRKRGIRSYSWAFDNEHILYIQDKDGDENWHVYATNLETNETRDLTPIDGVQARIQQASHRIPGDVLIAINDRNKQFHDVHRVNIATGERKLVLQNDGFMGFTTDDDFNVRVGMKPTPEGGAEVYHVPPDEGHDWSLLTSIPPDDMLVTGPGGFDKTGNVLYMQDSRGRDTGALFALDVNTRQKSLIAEDDRADVSGVIAHPTENTIQAVAFTYDRREWKIVDDAIRPDLTYLESVADGELQILSRSLDDKHWIVAYVMDDGPVRYFHYDRPAKNAEYLFSNRKALETLPLARMQSVVIKSRDGLNLVCYYTLPVWTDPDNDGRPDKPLPMVLDVHGGPWARDNWGYNAMHQWLANRGYAVMSVNFRGSTGTGKSFINAGNMQWGRKMQDDLFDAIQWAVDQGITTTDNVAIMGGSYGGYATLAALTMTPERFVCGVDIVGPSNLITLLESIPPYWKPIMNIFTSRVGDHRTADGRKLLTERSPLTYVDQIKRPLLIAQGANDPRVKQAESDQIVEAMQKKNIPVTYVLYPDEGHGFARPENRMSFFAVAEAFLAQHLDGRAQPLEDAFNKSSITIPAGTGHVPGLAEALPSS